MLEHSDKLEYTHYNIAGGNWSSQYQVVTNDTPIYHIENASPAADKPELTFYTGNSTNGPIAASGKYVRFSSDAKITIGNTPNAETSGCTTTLSKKGFFSPRHIFQMDLRGEKRTFTWKNTGAHESFGPMGSYKLVDEQDQAVAVLCPGGGLVQKDGYFHVYPSWGDEFDLMVLVTGLVVREKMRREKGERSYAAGGAASVA
ncbi:uncharacterized protein N7511_000319 [Penicillium nucicola]|uniref:uncharacterized protein n=1 Tax=Penicillium nucicola TaxID=1850975 RepID=UPI002544FD29|nr:uncharacterized protein N7511_000319 [Penicillium nucicola]KAJ5775308.1 hypothetical protein N7511_000319 [Penicillium nucicola]